MMILIDANVILRFLLGDNQVMERQARMLIESGNCYTRYEVIAEVIYVLEKVYHVQRTAIEEMIKRLFDKIAVEKPPVIMLAIHYYVHNRIDFVDGVLAARALLLGETVFTFDKKVQKLIQRGGEDVPV